MRVVHIITKLELGGAQETALYILSNLDSRRFKGLLVTGAEGILVDQARNDDRYDTVFLPSFLREIRPFSDLKTLFSLYRILRRQLRAGAGEGERTKLIVQTHSSKAGILGRAAARLAGVPVIIHTIHGYGFHRGQSRGVRSFYTVLERIVARWTTHFVAVSQKNIDDGLSLGLFPADKVSLIRSGIDISSFSGGEVDVKAKRAELGLSPGKPVVGMVACFKPQKNPVDFVRLAAQVSDRLPEAQFLVAGDGILRPEMEQAVREYGLNDRFKLLGWRRDVEEIIPSLDVLVLTSLWEGLPRVFPQAMAAGRPIVAYNVDGAPDAIADGVSGFLVEPGDYRGAAERVVELLSNRDYAAAMGRAGKERVAEFDADLMVRLHEELYERLLGNLG